MLGQPKYNTKEIDEELKSLEAQIALLEKYDINDVSKKAHLHRKPRMLGLKRLMKR